MLIHFYIRLAVILIYVLSPDTILEHHGFVTTHLSYSESNSHFKYEV